MELIIVKEGRAGFDRFLTMNSLIRCIVTLILSIAIFGTATVAQGPVTGPLSQMVICGEGGARTIWLDASGTPVDAPRKCCQCLKCLEISGSLPSASGSPACVAPRLSMFDPVMPVAAPFAGRKERSMPRGPPVAEDADFTPAGSEGMRRVAASVPALLESGQVTPGQILRELGHACEDARV